MLMGGPSDASPCSLGMSGSTHVDQPTAATILFFQIGLYVKRGYFNISFTILRNVAVTCLKYPEIHIVTIWKSISLRYGTYFYTICRMHIDDRI